MWEGGGGGGGKSRYKPRGWGGRGWVGGGEVGGVTHVASMIKKRFLGIFCFSLAFMVLSVLGYEWDGFGALCVSLLPCHVM